MNHSTQLVSKLVWVCKQSLRGARHAGADLDTAPTLPTTLYKRRPLTVLRINIFTSSPTRIRFHSHLIHTFAWLCYIDNASLLCCSGSLAGGKQECLISAQCQGHFTGIVAMSFADTSWLKLQMKSILPQTDLPKYELDVNPCVFA